MADLELQFENMSKAELISLMAEASMDSGAYKIIERKGASGDTLLDTIIELSKIDLNLLSLLIGFSVGKGVSVFRLLNGKPKKIDSLERAKIELLDLIERLTD